jgi:2-amino-4-hydroxy-6-hydroxymethyldihydropteridine diphosphokinase
VPPVRTSAAKGEGGIFLGLGSNLGDRHEHLLGALGRLSDHGIVPLRCSPIYLTEAVATGPQPDFLNLVVEVRTPLPPDALLTAVQAIETALGRPPRGAGKAPRPRTLDIDILLHRDLIVRSSRLSIPHPRLHLRRFVLRPLADLDAAVLVPGTNRSVGWHLSNCVDRAAVTRYLAAPALPSPAERGRAEP